MASVSLSCFFGASISFGGDLSFPILCPCGFIRALPSLDLWVGSWYLNHHVPKHRRPVIGSGEPKRSWQRWSRSVLCLHTRSSCSWSCYSPPSIGLLSPVLTLLCLRHYSLQNVIIFGQFPQTQCLGVSWDTFASTYKFWNWLASFLWKFWLEFASESIDHFGGNWCCYDLEHLCSLLAQMKKTCSFLRKIHKNTNFFFFFFFCLARMHFLPLGSDVFSLRMQISFKRPFETWSSFFEVLYWHSPGRTLSKFV